MLKRTGWRQLTRRSGVLMKCQGWYSPFSAAALPLLCGRLVTGASTSSMCAAARGVSSTPATPSVVAALSSSSTPGTRSGIKKPRLWKPEIMTHETLSYAECPLCGDTFYMRDMLFHITARHKEEDVDYWTKQCNARLNLYERVIGIPLPPSKSTAAPLNVALKSGRDQLWSTESESRLLTEDETSRPFLPTITADGAYTCNWCTVRHEPFPTRDAFLLHVAKDHPTMDFDVVESLVGPPPPASSAAAAKKTTGAAATAEAEMSDSSNAQQPGTSWTASGGHGKTGFTVKDGELGTPDAGTNRFLPSRRMVGVKTVLQTNAVTVALAPRQIGVSTSRVDATMRNPAALGSVCPDKVSAADAPNLDAAAAANHLSFRDHHFPCELCLKVFASELNLLNHLEGKHPPPSLTASPAGDSTASRAAASREKTKAAPATKTVVAETVASPSPASAEETSEASSAICVTCDLCTKNSKIYTLPSALFAHIRFSHRNADTTYEAERIMREQRGNAVFRCPHCSRVVLTESALRDHLLDHHSIKETAARETPLNGATAPADPISTANDQLAGIHAWPTLPPFSMKKRWWCAQCESGFRTAGALALHAKEKHSTVTELFPCPACRRIFQDAFGLEAHVKATHRSVQLVSLNLPTSVFCPHCNRGFLSYAALHEHCVKHHHKDPRSPVRSFAKPAESTAAASGAATATDGNASSEIAAPSKPRKVSRRKKMTSADA
ncbi:putative mitochondrial mitochondrial RNA binding protein 1 [Leptomonas pyrrhocoris]|uniref:Putative mitochondrial mitochondrial RNA binding protein 1 n=1 Tax=Leptomonas pyrrhocoris TaxID=157538 RepID=A0A0N0VGG2_LEPPY|nr:putative mitochondrial mitochondrial RNA binding protein 1 [Leptomonas pyrrhocoris]KPA82998.1 putative mitochondrial mitochondrial RNA binding protein 1 [Leptomonas pyrrhocoris]|eukprot:XP_015661437.1 putative mitochondrial mitochondrial RNA binding protein 1 [Leptomonas pyrrhocoris]